MRDDPIIDAYVQLATVLWRMQELILDQTTDADVWAGQEEARQTAHHDYIRLASTRVGSQLPPPRD